MDLFILDGSMVKPLGDIPGTIEDLRWTGDAKALIVKAADRGLDGGATNAATRLWWGGDAEPAITNPAPRAPPLPGRRRETDRRSRSVPRTSPSGSSISSATTARRGRLGGCERARLVSRQADPHRFLLARKPRSSTPRPGSSSRRRFRPSGSRVAFLEGWSSDRGLVASEIRLLDLSANARDHGQRRRSAQRHVGRMA